VYLEDTHGENIRVVYRHLPLISIHDKAVITAEAAEAAGAQGKFWEMHDLLYEKQQEWTGLAETDMPSVLLEYAEELDLDTDRFAQELEDHVYQDKILTDYEDYSQYGQLATPTYVVNNVFYPQLGLSLSVISTFVDLVVDPPETYDGPPPQVIDSDKEYVATIRTGKGDIVAELFAAQAPANVNSFVFLAQDGWYDGQDFFFVDPSTAAFSGDPTNLGWTLPFAGYTCGDEFSPDLVFDEPGMLALYTSEPGRNGGIFFITYAALPELNGQYTIIGRVIEGMGVVEGLSPAQPGLEDPPPDVVEMIEIEER
jgi:cyclophilin family peptidyl-prolyl cis-trans isomerase